MSFCGGDCKQATSNLIQQNDNLVECVNSLVKFISLILPTDSLGNIYSNIGINPPEINPNIESCVLKDNFQPRNSNYYKPMYNYDESKYSKILSQKSEDKSQSHKVFVNIRSKDLCNKRESHNQSSLDLSTNKYKYKKCYLCHRFGHLKARCYDSPENCILCKTTDHSYRLCSFRSHLKDSFEKNLTQSDKNKVSIIDEHLNIENNKDKVINYLNNENEKFNDSTNLEDVSINYLNITVENEVLVNEENRENEIKNVEKSYSAKTQPEYCNFVCNNTQTENFTDCAETQTENCALINGYTQTENDVQCVQTQTNKYLSKNAETSTDLKQEEKESFQSLHRKFKSLLNDNKILPFEDIVLIVNETFNMYNEVTKSTFNKFDLELT